MQRDLERDIIPMARAEGTYSDSLSITQISLR